MYRMKQSWRWFGPDDIVSLTDVKQTGATHVVTALHHIPHGEVWTKDEINKRKVIIEKSGLNWTVVESLTVHENIKTRSGGFRKYIDKYKESIRNVASCGISVITYNFMPVNDWTRTKFDFVMRDGSLALYFDLVDLAVFDIYLLKRKNAGTNYPDNIMEAVSKRYNSYSNEKLQELADIVMFGIPGEKKMTISGMREYLKSYLEISKEDLRNNLYDFLKEVCPVADECGVKMAIHPDDPPFDILGLPRIVHSQNDFDLLFSNVPDTSNGVCFCTGSLGATTENDLPAMIKKMGKRIHFIHLRNVTKDNEGNFFESGHLNGDVDMYSVVKELLIIQQKEKISIPFRPDHGHQMMDDIDKKNNPGYSAIGRMKGLAEIRGLEEGIILSMYHSEK